MMDAQIDKFSICVRPFEAENEGSHFDLPGKQIVVRDRLVEVLDEPSPRPLGTSDIDFALKHRLDTIYEFLTRYIS